MKRCQINVLQSNNLIICQEDLNQMKSILSVVQNYLRRFPAPAGIEMISNSLLKLNYSFSTPYTNSKNIKQVFLPITQIDTGKKLQAVSKKLKYDQKGRIQESAGFDSINVEGKHDKLLQDDVFGVARLSSDKNRWVYVAQVKEEKAKSYFVKGQGKTHFQYDFGQTYEGVKNAKIFVWDKKKRQVFRIETGKDLIPACPIFSNKEGSKIIFHAYKKAQFGHGLLHCFNRDVNIHEVEFEIEEEVQDAEKQAQLTKEKLKRQKQRLLKLVKLIEDGKRTNIFPSISNCFNYLIYCSGTGKTHTHYLDLVVMKRQEGASWKQLYRLKEQLVGYYCTLKLFPSLDSNGKPICYFQSISNAVQTIYKLDIQSGKVQDFSQNQLGQSFAISQLLQSGTLLGTTTTHNFNTFFYFENSSLQLVPPPDRENFLLHQYHQPIQGYYLEAPQNDILPQFKDRAQNRPLIFLVHGGPHGAIDPAFTLLRYTALKMGYGILMPNFPGSAGFGQQYLQHSLKNVGQTDMNAMIDLLQKVLAQRPYLDKKKVHVYGGSYGGYSGGILGSRYSKYFKSAIILNGVLSLPGQLFFTDIPEWVTVEALGKEDYHNLTAEDYAELYRQSPISQAMKIPVLQFLGAKDLRVPYRQGLLFDAMTRKQGTQIATYVYENSGHSLADSVETTIDVIVKSMLFLEGELSNTQAKAQKQIQEAQGEKIKIVQKEAPKQTNDESAQKIEEKIKENQNL